MELTEALRRGRVQTICDTLEQADVSPCGTPYRDCGRSPVEEAAHWHELGRWQWHAARFAASERSLGRALALRESVLGADHPDTLDTLERIAALHHYLFRPDAVERFRGVLARREPGTLAHGVTMRNLGACLRDTRPGGQGENELAAACELLEATAGSEHPDYVAALKARAFASYRHDPRGLRSLDFAERALTAASRCYLDDHPFVATAQLTVARCEIKLRRGRIARRRLGDALASLELAYGPSHPLVAIAIAATGDAVAQEDLDQAAALRERAYQLYRTTYAAGRTLEAMALRVLDLHLRRGDRDAAVAWLAPARGAARTMPEIAERCAEMAGALGLDTIAAALTSAS